MADADQASKSWFSRVFDRLWTVVSTLYKAAIIIGFGFFLVTLWFIWRCKQDGKAFLVRAPAQPVRPQPHRPSSPLHAF